MAFKYNLCQSAYLDMFFNCKFYCKSVNCLRKLLRLTLGDSSSVRRVLKRGGARNLRKFEKSKGRNEHYFTQIYSDFFPKIRKRAKKGLHSHLVRFFCVGKKQKALPTICVLKAQTFCPTYQGGGAFRNFAY